MLIADYKTTELLRGCGEEIGVSLFCVDKSSEVATKKYNYKRQTHKTEDIIESSTYVIEGI